jgi:ankyrin repeat protein
VANPKEDALLKAAQAGMAEKLRQLLAAGAPLEARDVNRKTPVMLAAEGGHIAAFRMLVEGARTEETHVVLSAVGLVCRPY